MILVHGGIHLLRCEMFGGEVDDGGGGGGAPTLTPHPPTFMLDVRWRFDG